MKKRDVDMLRGPLLPNIIAYAIPIMLTGIFKMLFNTADLAVMGQFAGSLRPDYILPFRLKKEDAIAAGKEALGAKLTGTIVKEIYVPGRIINIVAKG